MSGLARVASGTPARVMLCDDSATIRGAIARMLESDPGIQIVAKVSNGKLAIEELKRTKVDVLVLDIEMPVMDGITALPLLLREDPGLRVVMASTQASYASWRCGFEIPPRWTRSVSSARPTARRWRSSSPSPRVAPATRRR